MLVRFLNEGVVGLFYSLSLSKRSRAFLHVALVLFVMIGSTIGHYKLGMNLPQAVYETLRIFIIEADLDLPEGTWLANILWFFRFVAPALMAWGLLEMLRELGVYIPPIGWRNHIVIVGAGKVGTLVVQEVLDNPRYRKRKVVLLDTDSKAPGFSELRGRRNVKFQVADATSTSGLKEALVQRATHVFALTDDDITNIEIATAAMKACLDLKDRTPPQIFAQVSDTRFGQQISDHFKPAYKEHISFLNVFQSAAHQLVEENLQGNGDEKNSLKPNEKRSTLYLIAGFGRFGQALLDELVTRFGTGPGIRYLITDSRGEKAWTDYFRRDDTLDYDTSDTSMARPLSEDILSDVVTQAIHTALRDGWDVNLMISTDNDIRNLQLALEFGRSKRLRNLLSHGLDEGTEGLGHVHLVTRLFREPSFLVDLTERKGTDEHDIKTFNLDKLVVDNILSRLEPSAAIKTDTSQPPSASPTIASV